MTALKCVEFEASTVNLPMEQYKQRQEGKRTHETEDTTQRHTPGVGVLLNMLMEPLSTWSS